MKKLFLFLIVSLLFCACEGPQGIPGEPGTGTNWRVVNFTVKSTDWVLVGSADDYDSYYMAEFDLPSLSTFIYEEGNVQGYMFINLDDKTEVQTTLPYIAYYGQPVTTTTENLWTESYSFDFMPGSVAFYVRYSDFYTSNRPGTCSFRVVMTW